MQDDLDSMTPDPALSTWGIGVLAALTSGVLGTAGMGGIATGADGGYEGHWDRSKWRRWLWLGACCLLGGVGIATAVEERCCWQGRRGYDGRVCR